MDGEVMMSPSSPYTFCNASILLCSTNQYGTSKFLNTEGIAEAGHFMDQISFGGTHFIAHKFGILAYFRASLTPKTRSEALTMISTYFLTTATSLGQI